MPLLFVYGTLRDPEVQRRVLGREVFGEPASLMGWRKEWIKVRAEAAEIAGHDVHPVAVPSDGGELDGLVLHLLEEDWPALDAYEGEPYARVRVTLKDGRAAQFYAARNCGQ